MKKAFKVFSISEIIIYLTSSLFFIFGIIAVLTDVTQPFGTAFLLALLSATLFSVSNAIALMSNKTKVQKASNVISLSGTIVFCFAVISMFICRFVLHQNKRTPILENLPGFCKSFVIIGVSICIVLLTIVVIIDALVVSRKNKKDIVKE